MDEAKLSDFFQQDVKDEGEKKLQRRKLIK